MEHRSKEDVERINQLEKEIKKLVDSKRVGIPFHFTPDQLARIDQLMRVSGMDTQQQAKFFPQLLVIMAESFQN